MPPKRPLDLYPPFVTGRDGAPRPLGRPARLLLIGAALVPLTCASAGPGLPPLQGAWVLSPGPSSPTAHTRKDPETEAIDRIGSLLHRGAATPKEASELRRDLSSSLERYLARFPAGRFVPHAARFLADVYEAQGRLGALEQFGLDLLHRAQAARPTEVALRVLWNLSLRARPSDRVLAALERLVAKRRPAYLGPRIDLLAAQVALAGGDLAKALERLETIPPGVLDEDDRFTRMQALARAHLEVSLDRGPPDGPLSQARARDLLVELTSSCRKNPHLHGQCPQVFLSAGELALAGGDRSAALRNLQEGVLLFPGSPQASECMAIIEGMQMLGRPAPDLAHPDIGGGMISLASFRGKILLLDFWHSGCSTCLPEVARRVALHDRLRGRPFALVSICLDGPGRLPAVREQVRRQRMRWPQVYEGAGPGSPISAMYKVSRAPWTVVVDERGTIRHVRLRGRPLDHAVTAAVERLEAEGPATRRSSATPSALPSPPPTGRPSPAPASRTKPDLGPHPATPPGGGGSPISRQEQYR